MHNFQTVFIYETGPATAYFAFTAVGTLLFLSGLIPVVTQFANKKRFFNLYVFKAGDRWGSQIFLLAVGALLVVLSQSLNGPPGDLDHVYRTKKYEVTEGIVHVLHVQPVNGHDAGDIIRIAEREFEVESYRTNAYRDTIAHGGVLTEGMYARLFWHHNGYKKVILRVDIDYSRGRRLPIPKEATDHSRCGCGGGSGATGKH